MDSFHVLVSRLAICAFARVALTASPSWHRKLRQRRSKARRLIRAAKARGFVRPTALKRILAAKALLELHHTKLVYSPERGPPWLHLYGIVAGGVLYDGMEVPSLPQAMGLPMGSSLAAQEVRKARRSRQDDRKKQAAAKEFTGYDGTKLQWPSAARSSSSASKDKPGPEKDEPDDLDKVKRLLADMANQGQLDPANPLVKSLMEEDLGQEIKAEQRLLNAKRKARRKVENLRRQIEKREDDFKNWKQSLKILMQEESHRHEEITKLQSDLHKAEEEASKAGEALDEPEMISDHDSSSLSVALRQRIVGAFSVLEHPKDPMFFEPPVASSRLHGSVVWASSSSLSAWCRMLAQPSPPLRSTPMPTTSCIGRAADGQVWATTRLKDIHQLFVSFGVSILSAGRVGFFRPWTPTDLTLRLCAFIRVWQTALKRWRLDRTSSKVLHVPN